MAEVQRWQLADLQRTLICIGATLIILSHDNEASREAVTKLMGGLTPLESSRSFTLNLRPGRRPYVSRYHLHQSTLITFSLPESLCDLTYARLLRVSRDQVYKKCLQQGLLT